jgi:hypothetical protein
MQPWMVAFRDGLAPTLPTAGLEALAVALETDSPELAQGVTLSPPPLQLYRDRPPTSACPVAYCGWKGKALATVAEVEEFFSSACYRAGVALGDERAAGYFLNFWDDTPRGIARVGLLAEVRRELGRRATVAA